MNEEVPYISKVIDTFGKIGHTDAVFYSEFIEKALTDILKIDNASSLRNNVTNLIFDILEDIGSDRFLIDSPGVFTFKEITNEKNTIEYAYVADGTIGENSTEIILDKKKYANFISENELSLFKDRKKELIVLAVLSLLVEKIEKKKSKEADNDKNEDGVAKTDADVDAGVKVRNKIIEKFNDYEPLRHLCINYIYSRNDLLEWRQDRFIKINLEVFENLIMSILTAEFFKLDNYSQLIKDSLIKNEDISIYSLSATVIPYVFFSLRKLFAHIIERCRIVKLMFNEDSETKDFINVKNVDDWISTVKTPASYIETMYFESLVIAVCDLTDIDLVYTTNKDNIIKLMTVIKQCDIVSEIIDNIPDSQDFEKPLGFIKMKAIFLLKGMISQSLPDKDSIDVEYLIGDKKISDIMKNIVDDNKNIATPNPMLTEWNSKRGKEFNVDIFNPFFEQNRDKTTSQIDVKIYNDFVRHSIEVNSKLSSSIQFLEENKNSSDIDTFEKGIAKIDSILVAKGKENKTTSSFLYRSIIFIFKNTEHWDKVTEKINYTENVALLAFELLRKIKKYLNSYSDGNKPRYGFRPTFEYSFYQFENNKISFCPFKSDNKSFFFASFNLTPFNSFYIERFYEKYNIKSQEDIKKNQENIKKTQEDNQKKLEEDNQKIIHEMQAGERRNTVQILGVFAALLAFVSASIGMVRLANNPAEFALFCCAFTGGLLILVLAIKFISTSSHTKQERRRNLVAELKIIAVIFVLVILSALICYFNKDIKWGNNNANIELTTPSKSETVLINSLNINKGSVDSSYIDTNTTSLE